MDAKICTKCLTLKSIDQYHRSNGARRADCKACVIDRKNKYEAANKDLIRERARRWYAKNPEKAREKQLKVLEKRYGITREQYFKMIEDQQGCCKLCNEKKKLVVDHCHKSGHVRGLLCNECNQALGLFRDKLETLKKAIEYLNTRTVINE